MTYEQYRNYGYVSRLSEVLRCGGPTGGTVSNQNNITSATQGIASTAGQESQANQALYQQYTQPLATQQTALASGDYGAAIQAAMPTISKITGGYNAAQQQIMNTVPPGAARDQALANLQLQRGTTTGNAEAQMVQQAPQVLASLGSEAGNFSLQQMGAAISGLSSASSSNQAAGQMEAAQSAATWQPIMSAVSSAAEVLGSATSAGGSLTSSGTKG